MRREVRRDENHLMKLFFLPPAVVPAVSFPETSWLLLGLLSPTATLVLFPTTDRGNLTHELCMKKCEMFHAALDPLPMLVSNEEGLKSKPAQCTSKSHQQTAAGDS